MSLYSRAKLEADLSDLDRLEHKVSASVLIGEPDYFWESALEWLMAQPKFDPEKGFGQKAFAGLKAGRKNSGIAWANVASRWVETQRRRLRMKLLNAYGLLRDLEHAKKRLSDAELSGSHVEEAQDELSAAFGMLRWNREEGSGNAFNSFPRLEAATLEIEVAPERHEIIDLTRPEEYARAVEAAKAGQHVHWRPFGREIALVYTNPNV